MTFGETERRSSAAYLAAVLTAFQIILALLVCGGKLPKLVGWDAAWYRDIAAIGYRFGSDIVNSGGGGSNLALFPGFPIFSRIVMAVFHLPPDLGVTLSGWLTCYAMWFLFFAVFFRRAQSTRAFAAALVFFLIQPGSFYFSVGYSEAFFTAGILGYVYWVDRLHERDGKPGFPGAAVGAIFWGGLMTAGRLVGVPLVIYPILKCVARPVTASAPRLRLRKEGLGVALLSLWGFVSFLVYGQMKFGNWHAYWDANRSGWGVVFHLSDLFRPSYYFEDFLTGNLPEMVGRVLTFATLFWLLKWIWRQRRVPKAETGHFPSVLPVPLALLGLALLTETIIGSHGMHSMIRYLLPVDALVFPLFFGDFSKKSENWSMTRWVVSFAAAGLVFAIQIIFFIRYINGQWVS